MLKCLNRKLILALVALAASTVDVFAPGRATGGELKLLEPLPEGFVRFWPDPDFAFGYVGDPSIHWEWQAATWSRDKGIQVLPSPPGVRYGDAMASPDGSQLLVGTDIEVDLRGTATMHVVSRDGDFVREFTFPNMYGGLVAWEPLRGVGSSKTEDMRNEKLPAFWIEGVGLRELPKTWPSSVPIDQHDQNQLLAGWVAAVAADGTFAIGERQAARRDESRGYAEGFVWTESRGVEGIGDIEGGIGSNRLVSLSGDESTALGTAELANGVVEAIRWTRETGVQSLGNVPEDPFRVNRIVGISDNGSVAVWQGTHLTTDASRSVSQSFLWDNEHGVRSVRDLLSREFGYTFEWWQVRLDWLSPDGAQLGGRVANRGEPGVEFLVSLDDSHLLPGDSNFDGKVDLSDFGILKQNFGQGIWRDQGDFNDDERVDLSDFGILKQNFGRSAAAVPEPAGWMLTAVAFALLLARCSAVSRRRHT